MKINSLYGVLLTKRVQAMKQLAPAPHSHDAHCVSCTAQRQRPRTPRAVAASNRY